MQKSKPGSVLSALLKSSYVAESIGSIPVNITVQRESTGMCLVLQHAFLPCATLTCAHTPLDVKWGLGLGANNEITQVAEGSVAALAGVDTGYILTHANGEPVSLKGGDGVGCRSAAGV
jgi:hypothetical protein